MENRHKGLPVRTEHEGDDDGRRGKQPRWCSTQSFNSHMDLRPSHLLLAPLSRSGISLSSRTEVLSAALPELHRRATDPHRQALMTRYIRALPFPEKCSRLSTDLSRPGCHSAFLQRRTNKSTSLEKVFQRTHQNSPASDVSVCLE